MTDVPGEGFDAGAAYVSVTPEGEDFQEEVRAIVGETDIVVQVPVVPDAGDFRAALEEQVSGGDTAVTVPVVPDAAGFRLLLQDQLEGSQEPVTIPVVADPAGMEAFASETRSEAGAAGEAAGTEFSATFDEAMRNIAAVAMPEGLGEEFAAAGEEAGAQFSRALGAAAQAAWAGVMDQADAAAAASGEAAGTSWRDRFTAAVGSADVDLEGLGAAADATMGAAGEAAGLSFSERFTAIVSRAGALAGSAAEFAGIGAEDGEAAGTGFIERMKGVISGGMGSIEFLLGAGFVAATAIMANSFQEAMERLHTQAGVGQAAIAPLSNAVLQLAGQVGESPSGLAAALYHVESAFQSTGISGSQAMNLLRTAAEGARVGGADLVDTTNALDAIMVSGISGLHSYSAAMGGVNAIVGSGDMTMQDFANAAGSGLFAVAKTYGQSLPQIGAALATFGDNNIRGAKAATDLRMAMQAIAEPVTTAGAALAHLGLSTTTLYHTMTEHGLTAAVGQLVERLKASHTPIADWGEYVTDIFGKRAGVGIGVLVDQLSRMQGKLKDIASATHNFGNAWADTEATTSQKLHNLESGLEALMIKIGRGLLPYLDDIFTAISKALPSIEKWGAAFTKIASPVVKSFFTGLAATFKLLLGPLKPLTIAVAAFAAAWVVLDAVMAVNPFVAIGIALITLVGAIIRYRKQIIDALSGVVSWIKSHWVLVALLGGPFGALIALVVKFHKQIVDAFEDIWRDVEHTFDAFRHFVTSGFDSWWAAHGKELEEVWNEVWAAISGVFKTTWDTIVSVVQTAWALVGPFLSAGLDVLVGEFKVAWDTISAAFQVAWDLMAAVVKIAWAGITSTIKIAWDLIVGIFDVALDLLTGHWSAAWKQVQTTGEQIWNAIKAFFTSTWNAISATATQIWDHIKDFLGQAWNAIKSAAVSAFDGLRSFVASIWDGMISDAENFASKIAGVIGGIVKSIPGGSLVSGALGAVGIHLAGGGVIPGYAPGRDSVPAMLSPGEGVLTPEAVRGLGGAGFVTAANATFSGGRRGMASGGIVTSFADGGMATSARWAPAGTHPSVHQAWTRWQKPLSRPLSPSRRAP